MHFAGSPLENLRRISLNLGSRLRVSQGSGMRAGDASEPGDEKFEQTGGAECTEPA